MEQKSGDSARIPAAPGDGPMRVLIVDDSAANVLLLRQLISRTDRCEIFAFTDAGKAVAAIATDAIDIALVAYKMAGLDGIEFIRRVRAMPGFQDIPIVMVTTSEEKAVRRGALGAGATEFLTKPIDPTEVRLRISNLIQLRRSRKKLQDKAAWLAAEVSKATAALAEREEEIILRLAKAAEYRDTDTGDHILRMAKYCLLIARAIGLDDGYCRSIYLAAPMHDIGKIAISDAILRKPGALDVEERAAMQQHTNYGHEILADSELDLIKLAAQIAWSHHEHWDGNGYPRRLRGAEIPLPARIAAVADVFDALTSARPYKPAMSPDAAWSHIAERKGRQFDPACVDAFRKCWTDVLAICRTQNALPGADPAAQTTAAAA